ncbi:MAG: pilus assembly protein [Devosia nanyangense]|uniref:Pilus assembly protein n=1 Tax=Devosia nanyangense TaxID=1228055 RepID=A0A933L297_9HYPH|nr:pilus assembly protein [Devosia nanyangense]
MPRRRLSLASFALEQGAASAVEFALLAPVFLLMLFGMIAYAIYFGAAFSVQQIAADAARTSIAGLSHNERDSLVSSYIANNAGAYVLIDATRVTYAIGDKPDDVNQYQVTVSYDAASLPIWNLYVPLPLPSKTIAYTSVIRKGGR